MKTEKPAAPEGCKALWQDPVTKDWVLIDKDLDVACWNADREEWDYQYDFDQSQVVRELLRLAALNARLVEGLEEALPYVESAYNRSAGTMYAILDVESGDLARSIKALIAEHRGEG